MAKRTVDDVRAELSDKIRSLVRQRDKLILDATNIEEQIKVLVEQQLALDNTKVKILCQPPPLGCGGTGYIQDNEGKKRMCPVCGGPDQPYVWATIYKPIEKPKNESD